MIWKVTIHDGVRRSRLPRGDHQRGGGRRNLGQGRRLPPLDGFTITARNNDTKGAGIVRRGWCPDRDGLHSGNVSGSGGGCSIPASGSAALAALLLLAPVIFVRKRQPCKHTATSNRR